MGAMQWQHWVLVLVVVLLLFGTARLPGLAKSVGQSMKIFKKEIRELRDDKDDKTDEEPDVNGKATGNTDTPAGTSTRSANDKGGDAPKA